MAKEWEPRYSKGHDVEEGVLGEVNRPAQISMQEYLEKKERGELRDITVEQAIDIIKAHQPFKDSSRPVEKVFPKDVHVGICRALELRHKEQLRYYTAVGSLLDKWKRDAILELLLEDGKKLVVSWDITSDESKLAEKTADVSFLYPTDGLNFNDEEDIILFNNIEDDVIHRTVESFNQKANENGLTISSLSLEEIQRSSALVQQQAERRSLRLHHRPRPLRERLYAR